jgi:hypothetical protein
MRCDAPCLLDEWWFICLGVDVFWKFICELKSSRGNADVDSRCDDAEKGTERSFQWSVACAAPASFTHRGKSWRDVAFSRSVDFHHTTTSSPSTNPTLQRPLPPFHTILPNTMPPRRSTPSAAHAPTPPTAASAPPPTPATTTVSSTTSSAPKDLTPRSSPQEIIQHVWSKYINDTPPRILLLDAFMAFLVVVGGVQFVYCVLVGNYVRLTPSPPSSSSCRTSASIPLSSYTSPPHNPNPTNHTPII